MADEMSGEGPIAPDRDGESYDLWDRIAAGDRGPIAAPMAEVIDHAAGAELERLRGIIGYASEELAGIELSSIWRDCELAEPLRRSSLSVSDAMALHRSRRIIDCVLRILAEAGHREVAGG